MNNKKLVGGEWLVGTLIILVMAVCAYVAALGLQRVPGGIFLEAGVSAVLTLITRWIFTEYSRLKVV